MNKRNMILTDKKRLLKISHYLNHSLVAVRKPGMSFSTSARLLSWAASGSVTSAAGGSVIQCKDKLRIGDN